MSLNTETRVSAHRQQGGWRAPAGSPLCRYSGGAHTCAAVLAAEQLQIFFMFFLQVED